MSLGFVNLDSDAGRLKRSRPLRLVLTDALAAHRVTSNAHGCSRTLSDGRAM